MKKSWVFSLLLVIGFVGIDQLSKYFLYNQKAFSQLFFLDPLFNTGISWWMALPMEIVLVISLICIILFCYLFYKKYLTLSEFSLLLAGTLGNLSDRILLWGVRDFIAIGNFPVFNFADIYLSLAVGLLLIREFLYLQRNRKKLDS